MTFSPALRRVTFTTHVTSSVGWVGAVMVFVALAGVGLTSRDEVTVRGAYLVMAPAAWFVLVPLAHASLVSGVALSLGTAWGLFRHYWVVFKLLLTVFATLVLLGNLRTVDLLAEMAASPATVNPEGLRGQILHAGGGAFVLLVTAILGIYKPRGITAYGWRSERAGKIDD